MNVTRNVHSSYWLIVVLILAALLRFPDLGHKSLWGDEATSIYVSLGQTTASDHPPGYYFLSGLFVKALGMGEFQSRLFSALCGMLLIWGIYLLGRLVTRLWPGFPPALGLLSALLIAISPYFIQLSQESRPYSMIAALAAWSSYFFLLLLTRKGVFGEAGGGSRSLRYWGVVLGYLAATTLGLYTHYFYWFNLALQGLLWLYLFLTLPATRKQLLTLLILPSLVLLLFLPIAPRVIAIVQNRSSGIQASQSLLSLKYYGSHLLSSLFHFATGYFYVGSLNWANLRPAGLNILGLAVFVLISAIPFWFGWRGFLRRAKDRQSWSATILILGGLLISLLGALTIDTSIARQHSISAVFFFPLFALGFLVLPRQIKLPIWVGYGLLILLSLVSYYSQSTHPFYQTDWRSATAFIRQQRQPTDLTYVAYAEREGYYSLKIYALEGEIIYAKRPGFPENQSTWINPETGERFSEGHIIRTLLERSPRVWLVHPPIQISEDLPDHPGFVIRERRNFGRDLEVCLITPG